MPDFSFTAVDSQGRATSDRVSANSASDAKARLAERGLVVRSLEVESSSARIRERLSTIFFGGATGGVRSEAVAGFYRSLAVQLSAGIDIRRSISTLADQQRLASPALGRCLADIRERLAVGEGFGNAIAQHEAVFGDADIQAIKASEHAGVLVESLQRLADSRDATVRLRKRVISALSYPAMVLSIALVITLVLFTFVVPVILEPIRANGRALPLPTLIVAGASDLLVHAWWLLILLAIVAFFAVRKMLRTTEGKRKFDRFVLWIPVIGPMLQKHALAQSATLLGTTVRCGLNFVEGLDLTARASRNSVIRAGLQRWRDEVEAGRDVDDALVRAGQFPPLMIEMVAIGSTGGQLDAMLAKLAEIYENDVDETTRRMGALVGPALTVTLGGVVLLIALAVLLPILQLGDVFAP